MNRRQRAILKEVVSSLPENPSDDQLLPIAREFAQHALNAEKAPGRSIASFVRHYVGDDEYAARLRELANKCLHNIVAGQLSSAAMELDEPNLSPFISIQVAAGQFHMPVKAMRRLLADSWEFRRLCGWPTSPDGGRTILFPVGAFDSNQRASFLAALPDREPFPPPAGWARQP